MSCCTWFTKLYIDSMTIVPPTTQPPQRYGTMATHTCVHENIVFNACQHAWRLLALGCSVRKALKKMKLLNKCNAKNNYANILHKWKRFTVSKGFEVL